MVTQGLYVAFATIATSILCLLKWETSLIIPEEIPPPIATKRPYQVPFGAVQGQNRGPNPMTPVIYKEDPYFWLRDDNRTNKEVLSYLEAENSYCAYKMQHLEETVTNLYQELLSHVQEDDTTVPYKYGPYMYYTRTIKGSSYKIHCRKKNIDSPEEIILDENILAQGLPYCYVHHRAEPSPDHALLAYSVDAIGDEIYTIYIKDLETGKLLPDTIPNTVGSIGWGKDNTSFYYISPDEAHRSYKLWRHIVGTDFEEDECLATEEDELFSLAMSKSRSGKYLFVYSQASEESEYSFIDLESPQDGLHMFQSRQKDLLYHVDHHDDKFYIVTNKDGATNFKLMSCSITSTSSKDWIDVFQYDPLIKIDLTMCFADFLAIYGRQDGFSQIWIVDHKKGSAMKRLKFEDPVYYVHPDVNAEYHTTLFRFRYSSMVSPTITYDYDVLSGHKTFLKESPCPNYDRTLYECKRIDAPAEDGASIPISLVYRKDMKTPGINPVHLYGYGSYEITIEPHFMMDVLPLLDRGVIYAIAHIRGGGALGRSWYEEAKYLNKIRTFTDFISCAEYLISIGMTSPSVLSIEGHSAGGLLMGAVLNMKPQLFRAALAGVPFVDVLTTMSDATIPLTTGEWAEWGNPNEKHFYDYMAKYSPYDNIKAQDYPSILITGGLHDPRVAYWEPAKWCAKLRDMKTDKNPLLLKIDLESGHFSASDRYHYLKEKAFELAFLLDQLGLLPRDSKFTEVLSLLKMELNLFASLTSQ